MKPEQLARMAPLEFSQAELEHPVSLNESGDVATVKELLAEKASNEILRLFDISRREFKDRVRPVKQLDGEALKKVAIALLRTVDPKKRVTSLDGGDYTTSQLIGEVNLGTSMGQKIVRGVRLNGILLETAIQFGRVMPRVHTLSR